MTDRRFTDRAPLTAMRKTADGYLVGDVRCARTGCQDYMASDFGIMDGGVISVYRPEEVVFDKASLATFAGKPVTLGHPPEGVTAENWRDYAVGDVGSEIARDGDFVVVPYKIMDAAAIAAIERGTREVSMGYTTGFEMRDGIAPDGTAYQAVQTGPIRINHLAVVATARGGASLRIGDAADNWGAAPITPTKEVVMTDTLKTVVLGDQAVNVSVNDAPAIEAYKTAQAKLLADAKADADKTIAAKDAALATKDAEIDALKAKVLDAAALDNLVTDRADLIARAKAIHADVVTDGKSAAEIRKAVVVAKRGAAVADKSEAYIDAAFDLLNDGIDPAAKVLADMANGGKTQTMDAMYAARDKELTNAYKGGK